MAYAKQKVIRGKNGRSKVVTQALGGNTVYEALGDGSRVYQALGGNPPPMKRRARPVYQALGDYSDSTLCSEIPAGDPYRKPGNYCTQPSGNVIEFNADGTVDPDTSPSSSSSSSSAWTALASGAGSLLSGFANAISGSKPAAPVVAAHAGMSTGTKVALAGAAMLGLVLIARR